MMQALLFSMVAVLVAIGVYVLGVDAFKHGELHKTNTFVGAGALILAVALALPTRLRDALSALLPVVKAVRGEKSDV